MKTTRMEALEKAQELQRKLINDLGHWCDIIQDTESKCFEVSFYGGSTRFEYETVFFCDCDNSKQAK